MYWNAYPSNQLPVSREWIWLLHAYSSHSQTGENITCPSKMMQFFMTGRTTSTPVLASDISVAPSASFTKFTSHRTISIATLVDCLLYVTGCNPHINHLPSLTIGRATSSIINGHMASHSLLNVLHMNPVVNRLAPTNARTLPLRLQHAALYLILRYIRLEVLRLHRRRHYLKGFTRSSDGINALSVPFGAHVILYSPRAPFISTNLRFVPPYSQAPKCLTLFPIDISRTTKRTRLSCPTADSW